ncbi:MAG TPA: hypothetical protein VD996_14065 [Chitinophagaceae bacterium]|nr:hypothetical protein [Chitinophagaceae bacterium]
MKRSTCTFAYAIVLSALISGCKKQFAELPENDATVSSQIINETACKPTVFAVYERGIFTRWLNITQKWYVDDTLRYIKFQFVGGRNSNGLYGRELELSVPWAEVTYAGNQVYVRDVLKNMQFFRATLDGSGKVLASYYDNHHDILGQVFSHDTLYYYYTANRLDSVLRFSETRFSMPTVHHTREKYIFGYDVLGNIVEINSVNDSTRLSFVYDYSQPVKGIVANYDLTIPFRVAEFLDLVKLPMQHAITEVTLVDFTINGGTVVNRQRFNKFATDNGYVYAYHDVNNGNIFSWSYYTGWNCGTSASQDPTNRQNGVITSLEQFRQLYPASKK